MKSKDVYLVGLGGLHVLIFLRALTLAEQITALQYSVGKETFVIAFGVLVGTTIFLSLYALGTLATFFTLDEAVVAKRATTSAKLAVTLLSFVVISVVLKNFILFR